jgi:CheY-like chemotaxis protein
MPDMTGIDVLQRLKQISPDTDAVMMTGYAITSASRARCPRSKRCCCVLPIRNA